MVSSVVCQYRSQLSSSAYSLKHFRQPWASVTGPRWAVRSSRYSGMTPSQGSQRASFGVDARENEECRADATGLAPTEAPKTPVDMLLSPAVPEPSGQATSRIVPCQS